MNITNCPFCSKNLINLNSGALMCNNKICRQKGLGFYFDTSYYDVDANINGVTYFIYGDVKENKTYLNENSNKNLTACKIVVDYIIPDKNLLQNLIKIVKLRLFL